MLEQTCQLVITDKANPGAQRVLATGLANTIEKWPVTPTHKIYRFSCGAPIRIRLLVAYSDALHLAFCSLTCFFCPRHFEAMELARK